MERAERSAGVLLNVGAVASRPAEGDAPVGGNDHAPAEQLPWLPQPTLTTNAA
jgi:hypothetical protein